MGNCGSKRKNTDDLIQYINGIKYSDLPSGEQTRISAALVEALKRHTRETEAERRRDVTLIDHRCIIKS
jgi:TRAP-type C4-dicarboxylate transport system substrate-binding protein